MTLTALLLTLGCALAWAGFDAQRKAMVGHLSPVGVTTAMAILQFPVFALWAWATSDAWPEPGYWLPGAGVMVFNLCACVLFFEALRRSPLSATVPLLAFTPVFTTLLAFGLLDERVTHLQAGGIALVVLGAFWLNAAPGEVHRPRQVLASIVRESGSWLTIVVASLWSVTTVLDKIALQHTSIGMHVLVQLVALLAVMVGWMAFRGTLGELRVVRRRPWLFAAATVTGSVALALQLQAILIAYVGLVEAIKRAFGVMASLVAGRVWFGERISAVRFLAAFAISTGVWLVVM